MFKVYTDASVKSSGVSVHSYLILNSDYNFVEGAVFYDNILNTSHAEKHSIKRVIEVLKGMNIIDAEIHTDSVSAVSHLTKIVPYTLKWISRTDNKLVDLACILGGTYFYQNNKKLVDIWCGFLRCEEPEELTLNRISPLNVKEKHKHEMVTLYKEITGDDIAIEELFAWCEGLYSFNSQKGRTYLVHQLAVYNYFTDNHTKRLHRKLRDKTAIIQEAASIELTEKAYKQYVSATKKNSKLTFNKAKRKIYRDILLSVLDTSCSDKGYNIYGYGHLKIYVKDNTIECIEIANTTPHNWSKDRTIYKSLNKILGL